MQALLLLLAIALGGRVVLSLLPPGRPGYHEPRELPLTWAASHLLGLVVLAGGGGVVTFAAFAAVASVRFATLPGALVPRHELASPRGGWQRARTFLLALFVVAVFMRAGSAATAGDIGRAVEVANVAALALLTAHGLDGTRRHPVGTIAALVCLSMPSISLQALWFGGGAACAIRWWRLADRRAGLIAVIAFAAITAYFMWPTSHGSPQRLTALALLVLILASASPSRPRIALASGSALLVLLMIAHFPSLPRGCFDYYGQYSFESAREAVEWSFVHAPLAWPLALVALVLGTRRALSGMEPGGIAPPRREWFGILALVASAIAIVVLGNLERDVMLVALPILVGLGLARGERGA